MQWSIPISEGGAVNLLGESEGVEIEIIATLDRVENTIYLGGVHFTKNFGGKLKAAHLKNWARDFLRQHGNGATTLVIQPARRTTGATAGTGTVQRPITIELE